MKKFKPSELPVGTTIETDDNMFYTKEVTGGGLVFWDPGYCMDCAGNYTVRDDQADETFSSFKIVSIPFDIFDELVIWMGTDDGDTPESMLEVFLDQRAYREAKKND
jgi:hypothetical protein